MAIITTEPIIIFHDVGIWIFACVLGFAVPEDPCAEQKRKVKKQIPNNVSKLAISQHLIVLFI